MKRLRSHAGAAALLLLATSCVTAKPRDLQSFETRSADVYFVPIGPFAPQYLVSLASYYEDVFDLRVGVTPPLPYQARVFDPERRQLIAQELIALMRQTFDGYSENADAIFIGVTHGDMYIADKNWRFAYALRMGWHFAVVSSSRTARRAQSDFASIEEVHPGLRKMVTKTIGVLHYRKPMNSNPRSVLYDRVLGLDDLDRIDESTIHTDILGP